MTYQLFDPTPKRKRGDRSRRPQEEPSDRRHGTVRLQMPICEKGFPLKLAAPVPELFVQASCQRQGPLLMHSDLFRHAARCHALELALFPADHEPERSGPWYRAGRDSLPDGCPGERT